MYYLKDFLDRLSAQAGDTSLYGLTGWIASAMAIEAINKGETIYTRERTGFIQTSNKEFVEDLSKNAVKIHDAGKGFASYMYDDSSLVSISAGYEGDIDINFVTTNLDSVLHYEKIIDNHIAQTRKNTIFVLASGMDGYYLNAIGTVDVPLIRENYTEQVLKDFDFMVNDLNSSDPFGRLSVINGVAGTGKTYLIRGMIDKLKDSTIVLVPPKLIGDIDGPSLLPTFVSHKRKSERPIILIIEDADACLAPRMSDNMSSISSLLNHTDGILGSLLNLKIIATTNQDNMQFDPALTRPGRLSRHIEVGPLCGDKANDIYNRLISLDNIKKYKSSDEITLAKVYADAMADGGLLKESEMDPNFDPDPGKRLIKRRKNVGFGK